MPGRLRDWFRGKGLLPNALETVSEEAVTLDGTPEQILRESGLDQVRPIDR